MWRAPPRPTPRTRLSWRALCTTSLDPTVTLPSGTTWMADRSELFKSCSRPASVTSFWLCGRRQAIKEPPGNRPPSRSAATASLPLSLKQRLGLATWEILPLMTSPTLDVIQVNSVDFRIHISKNYEWHIVLFHINSCLFLSFRFDPWFQISIITL